jgi:hypothetical protein
MRRRIAIVAVALLASAPALGQAAHADGAAPRAHRLHADQRVPSARLQAWGSGTMRVVGRMVVNGSIPLRGTVVVVDRAGDATVHLAGDRVRVPRGRHVRIRRATGILFVTGSDVTVTVTGRSLSFSVAGNGRARLRGRGAYILNARAPHAWDGRWVAVAPTRPRPHRR